MKKLVDIGLPIGTYCYYQFNYKFFNYSHKFPTYLPNFIWVKIGSAYFSLFIFINNTVKLNKKIIVGI